MNLPKATMTLLVLFMLVCTSFTSAIPQEEQLGPPPPNGDWTVNDNTQLNDTKYVVNGSLTVTTSGILELINVTLVMDGDITIEGEFYLRNTTLIMNSTNNSYGIVVEAGALMHIFDYDNDPSTNDS